MIARSRIRLAWQTHYVGDLRAVNNELLDTYQLKSLDGILEGPIHRVKIEKKGSKLWVSPSKDNGYDEDWERSHDNGAFREPYDVIIRALGFTFDDSVFNLTSSTNNTARSEQPKDDDTPSEPVKTEEPAANSSGQLTRPKDRRSKKYPSIGHNYESVDSPGLFIAGTASHSLDFRKSAGGFIHGFRYTARALHRLLETRYESSLWPSVTVPRSQLISLILKRVNEASGTYQMFQMLGDIAILSEDGQNVTYIEEFPIHLLHDLHKHTGHPAQTVIAIVMEYGHEFSGPGKDVFRSGRATGDPSEADESNFLHPVMYYYKTLPTETDMANIPPHMSLPRPDSIHHIVEDFHTKFSAPHSHILPTRRWLETVFQEDTRSFYSTTCLELTLTHMQVPQSCREGFLKGAGLEGDLDIRLDLELGNTATGLDLGSSNDLNPANDLTNLGLNLDSSKPL